MTKVFYLLIFLSFSSFAESNLATEARKLLPQDLQELTLNKMTSLEVQKKLGKPQLIEGNKQYWEIDGFKYGLELTFDKSKKLETIHYSFVGKRPLITRLSKFDTEKLLPVTQGGKVSSSLMKLKEKDCEVVIDVSSKTIYSVRLP